MDLKLGCPECQGSLYGGQILHPRGCPSNHSCVPARLLNFLRWMTARLQLSLLKTVDLLLIGSREELNSMYLSNSITLSFLQLSIYQMLGCKKQHHWRQKTCIPSGFPVLSTDKYRDLQGAGCWHLSFWPLVGQLFRTGLLCYATGLTMSLS